MKRSGKPLSDRFCQTAPVGRWGDGRGGFGLALNVKRMTNGRLSKSWTQRLRINGRVTNVGLGRYPIVSLAEARQAALDNATMVAKGIDPRSAGIPTFAEAIEAVIRLDGPRWKGGEHGRSADQWRQSLRDHVDAAIHAKRIDKVTSGELFTALSCIWYDKPTTAKRIRQRLGRIMAWAVSNGYRADNPASAELMAGLRKQKIKQTNFKWLPFDKVSAALETVEASDFEPSVKLAFELLILTAARSGEVRQATWGEFDLDAALWTIPGERMKSGADHLQPLSARAVELLREARGLSAGDGLVFVREATGKPISNALFSKMLRDLGVDSTAHGFRTSWRVWASERTAMSDDAVERQLAHKVANAAKAAYDQSDRLEERHEGMERWALYLADDSAAVVSGPWMRESA